MPKYALIAILLLAAVLRIWNLSVGDITGNDEVLYAFRAVGMLDFDEAEFQTTPLEWFDSSTSSGNVPSWTKLSFHDHPPLVFLIQNWSIKIFGETVFGFRLPSAIFGILSVYLVYLLGRRMFSTHSTSSGPMLSSVEASENTSLIAALLTAITVNHIYISRIGIQESYVIFFLLLTGYLFLKALENDKYLLWAGMSLGFALLTKYTAGILIPIFITYLLIRKRDYFLNKKFWLGVILALVVFSPVIIYNVQLYRAVGHFDFQISYILGQDPEVWQKAPGKEEVGTLTDRILNFLPNLFNSNSWLFIGLFLLTIPISVFLFFKDRDLFKKKLFLDITLVWLVILLLFIGPTFRFLTMLTPFLALKIGFFANQVLSRAKVLSHGKAPKVMVGLIIITVIFEALYTVNSQILPYPIGQQFWMWSKIRYDNYAWGYNELDKFLEKELKGKVPFLALNLRYKFLTDIQNKALEKSQQRGLERYPALIIYDYNFQGSAQLWSLERLQIYHGWPVLRTEAYLGMLKENGNDFFEKAGIKINYFIIPTDALPLKRADKLTIAGAQFEQQLLKQGVAPISLYNKKSEEIFRIYKF